MKTVFNVIVKIIMVCIFLAIMVSTTVALSVVYMRYGNSSISGEDNPILNILQNNTPKEKVYALVLGTNQTLTDFIMVVGYNPSSGDISLLSIPRDTKYTGINGKNTAFSKINAIYQGKETNVKKLQSEVEDMLDIKLNYYVIFDKTALWKVVDAIGGVTVDVGPKALKYSDPAQNLYINLPSGVQKLDGKKAEQYVRFRKGYANGDIGRIGAQQNFIKAFIGECVKPGNLTKLPEVAKIGFENIKTDVTLDTILSYIDDVAKLDTSKVRIETLPGYSETMGGVSFYLMKEKEIKELAKDMFKWEENVNNTIDNNSNESSLKK